MSFYEFHSYPWNGDFEGLYVLVNLQHHNNQQWTDANNILSVFYLCMLFFSHQYQIFKLSTNTYDVMHKNLIIILCTINRELGLFRI